MNKTRQDLDRVSVKDWLEKRRYTSPEPMTFEEGTQTSPKRKGQGSLNPNVAPIGVGACACKCTCETGLLARLTTDMGKGGWSNFLEVAEDKWPDQVYQRTAINVGRAPTDSWDTDRLVFITTALHVRGADGRVTGKRLGLLADQIKSEGDAGYEVQVATTPGTGQGGKRKERWLAGVAVQDSPKGTEATYKGIESALDMLHSNGRKQIAVDTGGIDAIWLRKAMEHCAHGKGLQITLFVPHLPRRVATYAGMVNATRHKRDAVIIRSTEDCPYDQLVAKVKGVVGSDCKEISGIRRTRQGDLLIEVPKGEGSASSLGTSIRAKMKDSVVHTRSEECSLIIRGIDPTIDEAGIKLAIEQEALVPPSNLYMRAVRSRKGEKMAIISAKPVAAQVLLEKGTIRIGWSTCAVACAVSIKRCFKCWGVGHRAENCSGPDRTQLCRRCGGAGHLAEHCNSPRRCLDCLVTGHSTATQMCPRQGASESAGKIQSPSKS
jgi:hypothetical protein